MSVGLPSHPAPGSTSALRDANVRRILTAVRHAQGHGSGPSQAQIARHTDLAPATVSSIVRALSTAGVLEVEQGSGRRGATVNIGRGAGLVAGVALGHSHLSVAVGDLAGQPVAQSRIDLASDHLATDGLLAAQRMIDDLLDRDGSSRSELRAVGLGLPAPLSGGVVQSPGILPGWIGLDAAALAAEVFGRPVYADNDANLAALAELRRGDHAADASLVFVHVASGLGAGIVVNGEILRGATGMAGELGHVPVDESGPYCRCGNRGCLEAYASIPHLLGALHGPLPGVSFAEAITAASSGHPAAARALEDIGDRIGRALAMVVNLLEPDAVVIGGELAIAGELVLAPLRGTLRRNTLDPVASHTTVSATVLGENAGLIGSLELALDHVDLAQSLEL